MEHCRIEDRHDIGRLVAVWIGHPIVRASEHAQDRAQLDADPCFFSGFSDGTVPRTFIRFDGATDRRPVARINETNE